MELEAIAKRLQAVAQWGLAFCKDEFDKERYQEVIELAASLRSTQVPEQRRLSAAYLQELGYATPKVDVRAVVMQGSKVMLVRGLSDGLWTLPGGFADVGLTGSENVVKEVMEEAGYQVKAQRLLALFDRDKSGYPEAIFAYYKLFYACSIEAVPAGVNHSFETSEVSFFSASVLPPLSRGRVSREHVLQMMQLYQNSGATLFD